MTDVAILCLLCAGSGGLVGFVAGWMAACSWAPVCQIRDSLRREVMR